MPKEPTTARLPAVPGRVQPLVREGPDDGATLQLMKAARSEMAFTAVYRRVPEGYIAFVEELPGANTQGATLEEARANL